ncbi:MAG: hypothetical protein H7175_22860, partial [Burkholderiales bacterium]|nr:hypothetical protein [Anaerolineae bacterium]
MLHEAVGFYHDMLSNTEIAAADAHEQLFAGLRERNLFFGDRPLCRVLRPHFYTAEQWAYMQTETEHILSSFAKVHRACISDADLRAQLSLEPYEEELFHLDPHSTPWSTSRMDSFFTVETGRLQFVEYNAETPAGIGYGDELASAFLDMDVMKRFQERYAVHNLPGMGDLLHCLLRGYRERGGTGTPQIGIIDWDDVPTLTEHEICREYFEANGVHAKMADPRSLEYRNGALWADDFRIDLIYKRVLCSELIQRMGIDNPIVHALRGGDVQMSNSFSAKLLAKTASFAVLSDERN